MALNHRPILTDKKEIINLCTMFHSGFCLFHAKSCCLSDREKSCGFWCKLRSTLVFGIKQIVRMYVNLCLNTGNHQLSSS